nr:ribonuclease H-like domain-containing protein [Tanacetum cinerariifolium]
MPVETPTSTTLVSCDGLGGYDWSDQIVNNYKKGLGYVNYNTVPPPYIGNFLPSTPDLSFIGLDEFANKLVFENYKARSSEEEPKVVRKNDDTSIIEEWVSGNEEEDVSQPKIEKKSVRPSIAKIEFVKSKHQEKIARKTVKQGNPQMDLHDQGVIDSGCSRHMIGNMSYLIDYEEIDEGYVAFGGNPKGGKITRKCTIKTGNLDFENVYFVRELKFNLFSVSHMCDKKNSVLFNDIECIILSPNFKLIDESQVLLRVPRKNNMYSVDLKNIFPKGGLTCLFEKATSDESKLWHRRLFHLNFKTMNKLVKGNLVRGLPLKLFENDQTCVACQKGKQHRASCTQSNGFLCTKASDNIGQARKEIEPVKDYILLPLWTADPPFSQDPKSSNDDGYKPSSDDGKKFQFYNTAGINEVNVVGENISVKLLFDPNISALEDVSTFDFSRDDEDDAVADINSLDITIQVGPILTTKIHKYHPLDQVIGDLQSATQIRKMSKNLEEHGFVSTIQQRTNHKDLQNCLFACFLSQEEPKKMSSMGELTFFLGLQVKQKKDGIFISQDKYVAEILKKLGFIKVKTVSTPMETQKHLLKDEDGEEVDVYMYRTMIGSLMYLTSSRPDIMFVVCAYARYQVNPKVSLLHAVERIFSARNRQWLEIPQQKLIYGKKIIVTESSVRRDLRLADEESIDCLPNSTIFEQTALMGKLTKKDTQAPQPSGPTKSVTDEVVHKELGDRLTTPNEPSSQGTDSGGGLRCQETIRDTTAQTRLKLDELMALCTNQQNKVLDLEKTKTTQHNEIASLKMRAKKLEKKNRSRTHRLKRLYKVGLTARVESSRDEESLGEDGSKQGRRIDAIDADKDITLVNDWKRIRSKRDKFEQNQAKTGSVAKPGKV